jgi:signal transduction histidine kinase
MQDQVDHVVRLVDDLMDVSRINQGKVELRRQPVDLTESVREAVSATVPFYERRELLVVIPDDPIWVDGDRTRLVQVLGNLLHNAAKFTEQDGKVEIIVELSGDEAIIKVHDNGIGVAADQQQRIFEMFAQGDVSLGRTKGPS